MNQHLSDFLKSSTDQWAIEFRVHATRRMFSRRIGNKDVRNLLSKGTVIEEYQDDLPFPSVLVNGFSNDNRPYMQSLGLMQNPSGFS